MSDSNRSLVFPMTAGDLVVSAEIVAINRHATGGSEVGLMEVIGVRDLEPENVTPETRHLRLLEVTVCDWSGNVRRLELHADTPLLLTGIRRR